MVDLNLLTNAAFRYDSGIELKNEELQLLFRAGSSPGGARPKALIQKETGSLWIAKFPSCNDKLDLISIEAATLELAKLSGLIVPRFERHKAGGRNVLLVHRFDISNKGGRHHMISLQTLLQAEGYYFICHRSTMFCPIFMKKKTFTLFRAELPAAG